MICKFLHQCIRRMLVFMKSINKYKKSLTHLIRKKESVHIMMLFIELVTELFNLLINLMMVFTTGILVRLYKFLRLGKQKKNRNSLLVHSMMYKSFTRENNI